MPEKPATPLLTHLLLFVFILFSGCKASGNRELSNDSFDSVVKSKLGPDYLIEHNSNHRLALCQQKRSDNDHMRRTFKFAVVQLNDNKILHEGSFALGYVKWIDVNTIEVATTVDDSERTNIKTIVIDSEL